MLFVSLRPSARFLAKKQLFLAFEAKYSGVWGPNCHESMYIVDCCSSWQGTTHKSVCACDLCSVNSLVNGFSFLGWPGEKRRVIVIQKLYLHLIREQKPLKNKCALRKRILGYPLSATSNNVIQTLIAVGPWTPEYLGLECWKKLLKKNIFRVSSPLTWLRYWQFFALKSPPLYELPSHPRRRSKHKFISSITRHPTQSSIYNQ